MKWAHFLGGLIGTAILGTMSLATSVYIDYAHAVTWWTWVLYFFTSIWTVIFIGITIYGLITKSEQEKYYEMQMKNHNA